MKLKKYIFLLLLSLVFFNTKAQIFTSLSVSGNNWTPTIDASSVVEPGSDYATGFHVESLSNQNEISVTSLVSGLAALTALPWQISVEIEAAPIDSWGENKLELAVKRTDSGTGSALIQNLYIGSITLANPTISGGTTYQTITNGSTYFFEGTANYHDIPVQYKLSGISVLYPTDITYTAEVIYTVSGLL